jgi:hypothetical protein
MVAWDPDAPRPLRWFPKVITIWDNMVVLVPSASNTELGVKGIIVVADEARHRGRVWTEDGRDDWFDIDAMADPTQTAA